jgi:hypothetical protein
VFDKIGLYLTRDEQGGAQGCEDWDLALRVAEVFSISAVPERLVAYRLTRNSMSADAESMAKSFVTVIHRARQRNRDLPSATFRWARGNFYRYLANRCDYWGNYPRFFRYFKDAILANPVFLLDAVVYITLLKSVFRLLARSFGIQRAGLTRETPERVKERENPRFRKRRQIVNVIFDQIEARRWSAALNDQT